MAKLLQVPKQITITEPLWGAIEELGKDLNYGKKPHSKLIREMVSSSITKWRESPYVCNSAHHLLFVTANGHVFYRQVQDLVLNSYRQRLPCVIEMKPEKQADFLRNRDRQIDEASWLRSRWLLNHFAVWHRDMEYDCDSTDVPLESWGPPLDRHVDRQGMVHKMADLSVEQGPGRFLTRETLVGVQDYVQWHDGQRGYDRVDIPIDIPTRDLRVSVIVDTDLYRSTPVGLHEIPHLELEFRNREGARFEVKEFPRDTDNPLDWSYGKHHDDETPPNVVALLQQLEWLDRRIRLLAGSELNGRAVLGEEEARRLKETLVMPKKFLFLRARWPSPYFGVELCVRWEKAVRVG